MTNVYGFEEGIGLFWVFIDIDGTILDIEDNVRLHTCDLFQRIVDLKGTIIVWSEGGENYAKYAVRQLPYDAQQYIWLTTGKNSGKDQALLGPKVFIDDSKAFIDKQIEKNPESNKGFKVPFLSILGAQDEEFLEVMKELEAWVEEVIYKFTPSSG
jgi:FMN phosphatase YigB (HAD superfamily)